jgi:hypothetical protein
MMFGHQHRYEPVAVERRAAAMFSSVRSTVVLYRCRCNDVWSKLIDGGWTLAQVCGEQELVTPERVETDVATEAPRSAASPAQPAA